MNYTAGQFEVRADERQILAYGKPVPLGARAFDLLLMLIEHRDRFVGRNELMALVWPGLVVEESNLTVQMSALRKALGADAVATVPKRGYRLRLQTQRIGLALGNKPAVAGTRPVLPDKPSIAVLPFLDLCEDAGQSSFVDGITEDITTELSRFRSLFVIARNSAFVYQGRAVDVRRVSRELGVRYLLEGSVRRRGQRVRVVAQLIDALSGEHLWVEKYDRVLEDIFDLQDELSGAIVAALAPRIHSADEERVRRIRPARLDAHG